MAAAEPSGSPGDREVMNHSRGETSLRLDELDAATMGALVEQARAGSGTAFANLVEAHAEGLYNYLLHLLGDREEAEDLTQETFLRAWQSLPRFRGGALFTTWVYRIATNLAIDTLRRRGRRPQSLSLDQAPDPEAAPLERQIPASGRSLDDEVAARELQEAVRKAIAELPPKLRAVVLLYDFQQLSYEQIAAILTVPLGTVKSRLFNARQQLKTKLANLLPIEEYLKALEESPP
jgi:RNA polymerase sigma-70 factor (ECF subfamily)